MSIFTWSGFTENKCLYLTPITYEEESANMSQIYTKRKTCDIRNWKKAFISRHILHQHWYTYLISLPVRWNTQNTSLFTVVSATSAPPFQLLRHKRKVWRQVVNRFTPQTLLNVNRKISFWISFELSPFVNKKNSQQNAIMTTETSLWTCACASATYTVMKTVHALDYAATVIGPYMCINLKELSIAEVTWRQTKS
jgi:hypothetical protein